MTMMMTHRPLPICWKQVESMYTIEVNTSEMTMDVPTKAGRDTVWTPMMRTPIDTTSAWMTPKKPSNIHRPMYLAADDVGPIPSSSTSSLRRRTSENAPIHSARFVNRGAIADP